MRWSIHTLEESARCLGLEGLGVLLRRRPVDAVLQLHLDLGVLWSVGRIQGEERREDSGSDALEEREVRWGKEGRVD